MTQNNEAGETNSSGVTMKDGSVPGGDAKTDSSADGERKPEISGERHGPDADDQTTKCAHEAELESVKALLEAKDKELNELTKRFHRALADYDNLRRRSAKEVLEASAKGTENFIKKLLPVLDTLDSAMRQITSATIDKKVVDGLEMFCIQFTDVLEKEGLREIPARGQKFDPNLHEAMCKKCCDEFDEDVVLTEFEKGYIFKDRVLRPAKVEINQK